MNRKVEAEIFDDMKFLLQCKTFFITKELDRDRPRIGINLKNAKTVAVLSYIVKRYRLEFSRNPNPKIHEIEIPLAQRNATAKEFMAGVVKMLGMQSEHLWHKHLFKLKDKIGKKSLLEDAKTMLELGIRPSVSDKGVKLAMNVENPKVMLRLGALLKGKIVNSAKPSASGANYNKAMDLLGQYSGNPETLKAFLNAMLNEETKRKRGGPLITQIRAVAKGGRN